MLHVCTCRILYVEKPEDSTKRLLKLIDEFGKVTGYKINMRNAVVFQHNNNEFAEKEKRKQSHSQ
jgi:hypothetical protein